MLLVSSSFFNAHVKLRAPQDETLQRAHVRQWLILWKGEPEVLDQPRCEEEELEHSNSLAKAVSFPKPEDNVVLNLLEFAITAQKPSWVELFRALKYEMFLRHILFF